MAEKRILLGGVAVIRLLLVLLLVFYHAFAIYNSDAWAPLSGFPEIRAYWWLDKLSYAFMLEMFVFVSGYVFGYQVRTKGEVKLQAKRLFAGKFKRLIVPSIVFSILYILMFGSFEKPIQTTIYDIVNGVAHMWFLPMLFLCFTLLWAVEKSKIKSRYILAVSALVAMVVPTDLPLRIGVTLYYFPFFYAGYLIQRKEISLKPLYCTKAVLLTVATFAFLFPVLTLLREYTGVVLGGGNISVLLGAVAGRVAKILYATVGIVMTLSVVGTALKDSCGDLPVWMMKIGNLSMGIYLLQQFILVALYRHTILPSIAGPYLLPWVGFVVALLGSMTMAFIIQKTKAGRQIIG